jgi:hypothetical protein
LYTKCRDVLANSRWQHVKVSFPMFACMSFANEVWRLSESVVPQKQHQRKKSGSYLYS